MVELAHVAELPRLSDELAYIRVSADLLDDILIEVAGVAHQASADVVCVLEAAEDVKALYPAVVLSSQVLSDVVLELDHVVVGNLLCVRRREDGSSFIVNAGDKHGRRSRECCQRDASQGAAHDVCMCWGGQTVCWEENNGMDGAMEEVVMGRKEEEDGGVDKRSSRVEWWQATTRRVTAKVPELKSDRADP
jgi:hypothetical protein